MTDGMKGGPLAVFDTAGNTILISPSDNFMAISMWHDQAPGGTVNWGVMGGVDQIPAGYSVRVVAVAASGINQVGYSLHSQVDYSLQVPFHQSNTVSSNIPAKKLNRILEQN